MNKENDLLLSLKIILDPLKSITHLQFFFCFLSRWKDGSIKSIPWKFGSPTTLQSVCNGLCFSSTLPLNPPYMAVGKQSIYFRAKHNTDVTPADSLKQSKGRKWRHVM